MIVDNGRYYLYRHIRLDKNEPFYIGIGSKSRQDIKHGYYTRAHSTQLRNNHWVRIVAKADYVVEILLESNSKEFIKEKEIEFIKIHGRRDRKTGTLVNMTDGGDGCLNCKQSSEHIEKRKESIRKTVENRGYLHSKEVRNRLSLKHKGKKMSEEAKEKMKKHWASIRTGPYKPYIRRAIKMTKEEKDRVAIENLKKADDVNRKPVLQFTKEGEFVKEWPCILAAKKSEGIHHIGCVCKGNRKIAGGFIWKFKT